MSSWVQYLTLSLMSLHFYLWATPCPAYLHIWCVSTLSSAEFKHALVFTYHCFFENLHAQIMFQQNVQPCKTGIWSSIFTSGKQIWRPSAQNFDTTRQPKVFALKYVQFHLKPFESCSAQSLTYKARFLGFEHRKWWDGRNNNRTSHVQVGFSYVSYNTSICCFVHLWQAFHNQKELTSWIIKDFFMLREFASSESYRLGPRGAVWYT